MIGFYRSGTLKFELLLNNLRKKCRKHKKNDGVKSHKKNKFYQTKTLFVVVFFHLFMVSNLSSSTQKLELMMNLNWKDMLDISNTELDFHNFDHRH